LGSEQGFSVREIIHVCEEVTGIRVPVVEGPRRAGDAPRLVADARKAKTVLGWQPARSALPVIVADAWRSCTRSV
jgi:UDP-glucose 4-epimerase